MICLLKSTENVVSSTANIYAWLISYFSSVYLFSHWLVFLGEKLSKATLHIYIIFYLWCSRKKIICLCEHYEKRVGNISTLYTNKIDLGSRISRTHMHICINQSHHYSFFIHSSVDFAMFSLALSLAISNCDVFFRLNFDGIRVSFARYSLTCFTLIHMSPWDFNSF